MYCGFSIISYYEASPDWIKAVWVLSLPFFVVGMTGLILHHRVAMRRLRAGASAEEKAVSRPDAPLSQKDAPSTL